MTIEELFEQYPGSTITIQRTVDAELQPDDYDYWIASWFNADGEMMVMVTDDDPTAAVDLLIEYACDDAVPGPLVVTVETTGDRL